MDEKNNNSKVKAIIPNLKRKTGWFKSEVVNLVFTDEKLVMAKLTSDIIKKEVKEKNEQAKKEGNNILSRMASSAFAGVKYYEKYYDMPLDEILSETPGNTVYSPSQIQSYKIKKGNMTIDPDGHKLGSQSELNLKINNEKIKFKFEEGSINADDAKKIMEEFMN